MLSYRIENLSRRGLLKGVAAGSGLVLAARFLPAGSAWADEPKVGAAGMPHGTVNDPRVFVSIASDGTVSIVCHRAEMGQGVRTGIPLIVAEELEADWQQVEVVQATGNEERYGNQDTDGSRSTRHFMKPMREVGAAARMMLEAAAAKRWGVDVKEVQADMHQVVHKASGKKLGYGELAVEAAAMPVPPVEKLTLKRPEKFRYIGKGAPIIDGFDIVTGQAQYSIDVRLPGMKYAVIARPPVHGGKLRGFDAAAAMKVPGVEKVMEIPGTPPPAKFNPQGGVAVIAANTWAAIKGREALKLDWDDGPNASHDSAKYKAEMSATAAKPGKSVRNRGDVDQALAGAAKKVEAEYYIPHHAHATMEPPSATALFEGGKCEVWTGVQSPQAARDDTAKMLKLKPEDVTVYTTLLGGGFGRKSKPDFAIEAAIIAQAMPGVPIRVHCTRIGTIITTRSRSSGSKRASTPAARRWLGATAAWRRRCSRSSSPIPATKARSRWGWASSTIRSTSPISAARRARPRRACASVGSARSRTCRTPSRCNRWPARWRMPPARTPRTISSR